MSFQILRKADTEEGHDDVVDLGSILLCDFLEQRGVKLFAD